jgi:C_GCAxxG_C_C family probable redox protein
MNDIEQAVSYFKEGFLCSQAIFSTYGPQCGLDQTIALKIASPFGAGIGRFGKTCGAVTGALMVIGLKYGWTNVRKFKEKEKTYEIAREYLSNFISRHGTITCKKLLHCDISTPEGRNLALEKKLFIELCPKFVKDSAEILEEILKKYP